jgi:hypothetical protein
MVGFAMMSKFLKRQLSSTPLQLTLPTVQHVRYATRFTDPPCKICSSAPLSTVATALYVAPTVAVVVVASFT